MSTSPRLRPGLGTLHLREVLRNPGAWPAGLAVGLLGLAFRDPGGAVGLVSLVAALQVYVPPLLLVLAAPLLTRRDTWAFWAALHPAPGRTYVRAAAGIAVGAFVPLAVGASLAALALGTTPTQLALLYVTLAASVVAWTAAAALASAVTLDATRALAIGLAGWALVTLAYGPTVVALANAAGDRPLFGLLTTALLLNPADAVRVGLLEALDVPVLVGPVAVLLRDALPGPTLAWGVLATVAWSAAFAGAAALVFARRDR